VRPASRAEKAEPTMENTQQQELLGRLCHGCPIESSSFVVPARRICEECGVGYADMLASFNAARRQTFAAWTVEYDASRDRLHFTRPAPERAAPVRQPQPSTPSSAAEPDNAESLGFAAGAGAVYDPAEIGRAAREYQQKVTASGGRAKTPTTAEAVNHVLRERGLPVG
jgi:uncharacterized OB-fold protein